LCAYKSKIVNRYLYFILVDTYYLGMDLGIPVVNSYSTVFVIGNEPCIM